MQECGFPGKLGKTYLLTLMYMTDTLLLDPGDEDMNKRIEEHVKYFSCIELQTIILKL